MNLEERILTALSVSELPLSLGEIAYLVGERERDVYHPLDKLVTEQRVLELTVRTKRGDYTMHALSMAECERRGVSTAPPTRAPRVLPASPRA